MDTDRRICGMSYVFGGKELAAKRFLLNISSWKNNEFIKENYYGDIQRIESEMKEMVKANDGRKMVEWEIRQVVLERK